MKSSLCIAVFCLYLTAPAFAVIWSDPVLLPELNDSVGGYNAGFPHLSADGLTMYFTRKTSDGISRMWEAYRDAPDGPFTSERQISELYDGRAEYTGWVSSDGLRLYYTKSESYHDRTILRMAQRDNVGDPWQEVISFTDIHTYQVYDAFCSLTADELTIYYSRGNPPASYDIYTATRSSIDEQFSDPVPVTELNGMTYTYTPFIMPDNLSIFYAAGYSESSANLYMATRNSAGEPFGDIEFLNINTSVAEGGPFPYVAPDLSALYFHTPEGIWMSTAIPEPMTALLLALGGFYLRRKTS